MSQLTVTLPDDLEYTIRSYAREHGFDSVSDFIRDAASKAMSDQPTYWERAYLAHLMEVKQALGKDINEELLDALRNGYPRYYSFEEMHVSKVELSDDAMRFVEDTLGMYAHLQRSYRESGKKDAELEKDLQFPGFDGNAGDGHLGYLGFLVRHNRFTYVQPLDKGHAINSHSIVTHIYERMLDAYESIKIDAYDSRPLTIDEIQLVIDARIHPENRK